LSNSKLQEHEIHRSFKGWELQECPSKRSFNVVAARAQKLEELQGGGRSGSLKVSSLLLLLFYFLYFFCCKEDDKDVTVVFFCLFLLQRKR
jgi:hypothetical protein